MSTNFIVVDVSTIILFDSLDGFFVCYIRLYGTTKINVGGAKFYNGMLINMKILHVLSQRPDSTGSGIYVQAMIREADLSGYENFLVAGVSLNHSLATDFIECDNCRFLQFDVGEIGYEIPGMSDVMPYESSKFCELSDEQLAQYRCSFSTMLKEAVASFKPDIIHTNHLWIVTSMVKSLFPDLPVVTSCHGSDLRQFRKCRHLQSLVLDGCRNLDKIFALSQVQKNEIVELYGIEAKKIAIVGVGYNDQIFHKESSNSAKRIRLIYAGKLSNSKGVPWLLKALQELSISNWELDLVGGGSGEEKEHCLKLAEDIGEQISVHGAIPQLELARLLSKADIFILPSFFEGMPLVVLEALASGCRLIVNDLPGVREILGDLKSDLISIVPLPRLVNTDQLLKDDEPKFIDDLQKALLKQINHRESAENSKEREKINLLLESNTWHSVFQRVNKHYNQIMRTYETNV